MSKECLKVYHRITVPQINCMGEKEYLIWLVQAYWTNKGEIMLD